MSDPLSQDDAGDLLIGSGNYLLDRGYPDPGETRLKFEISVQIASEIERRKISHADAAKIVGLDQPEMSRVANGIVGEFSLYRLMGILASLGKEIVIEIGSAAPKCNGSVYVVSGP